MAFFSFPRIFDGFLYYNFFSLSLANHMTWYRWLNRIVWILHMWQYVSLFQLSYISSKENFSKWYINSHIAGFLLENIGGGGGGGGQNAT